MLLLPPPAVCRQFAFRRLCCRCARCAALKRCDGAEEDMPDAAVMSAEKMMRAERRACADVPPSAKMPRCAPAPSFRLLFAFIPLLLLILLMSLAIFSCHFHCLLLFDFFDYFLRSFFDFQPSSLRLRHFRFHFIPCYRHAHRPDRLLIDASSFSAGTHVTTTRA